MKYLCGQVLASAPPGCDRSLRSMLLEPAFQAMQRFPCVELLEWLAAREAYDCYGFCLDGLLRRGAVNNYYEAQKADRYIYSEESVQCHRRRCSEWYSFY